MSSKDSAQPYANLCILNENTSSLMAQSINKFFIICSIMNAFFFFKNVTNVLLQSSKLELLHKLFFKIPWVVACCKSTAFIPKLLFQCQLFPMHFLLNVANHFHVFLSFTTPYFLSSTPSSSPFTTILVFVEII